MDKTIDPEDILEKPNTGDLLQDAPLPDVASFFDLRALARAYRMGELNQTEYLAKRRSLISAFQICMGADDETIQAPPAVGLEDELRNDYALDAESDPFSDQQSLFEDDAFPRRNHVHQNHVHQNHAHQNHAYQRHAKKAPEDVPSSLTQHGLAISDVYSKVADEQLMSGGNEMVIDAVNCPPLDLEFGDNTERVHDVPPPTHPHLVAEKQKKTAHERFAFLTWRGLAISALLVASASMASWLAVWLTGL